MNFMVETQYFASRVYSFQHQKSGRKIFSDCFFDENLENNLNPKIRDNLFFLGY